MNLSHLSLIFVLAIAPSVAAADPSDLYRQLIPEEKQLDSDWLQSLTIRGHALDKGISGSKKTDTLKFIGMPVGGIACGTLIMDGAGQLYSWDIFRERPIGVINQNVSLPAGYEGFRNGAIKKIRPLDGANFMNPPTVDQFPPPVKQGFAVKVDGDDELVLGPNDWNSVEFVGHWPIGSVHYKDPSCPVEVELEAYSPFIPLNLDDSRLPATVMSFTVKNASSKTVVIDFDGWLGSGKPNMSVNDYVSKKASKKATGILLEYSNQPIKKGKHRPNGSLGIAVLDDAEAIVREDVSGLRVSAKLAPGESREISFVLAWNFGHDAYSQKFDNASEVIDYVSQHYERLSSQTQLWVDNWNNTSLPQWFMDRSMASASTMQTANLQFAGDRFWAYEGIGAGTGTCTHVWAYAQTMARLFPSLERNLREVTDFGLYQMPDGGIPFRPSKDKTKVAIDGQCGTVLRSYREHLISANDEFLIRNWPSIKKAISYLIDFDKGDDAYDGLLDGEQHNTLDAEWYGKVHVLCSLYLAALRAGEEMAIVVGDTKFQALCRSTYEMGRKNIERLYNGEHYVQIEDPNHPNAIGVGKGAYIDQVYGQFWANQVGLGRLYNKDHIQSALNSIWKYNYVTDVGPFREVFRLGRFYAWQGDGGVLMCTWPNGGMRKDFEKHWQYGYFNEVMSGFEHQLAAHMIAERDPDLLLKGLTIMRTIHDRYSPAKRNPYNEVEFSDFYARAMASYGSFLAACGFEYNGPVGMIGFDPIIQPEKFHAPFTAAEGWGTYSQTIGNQQMKAELEVKWGSVRIKSLKLNPRDLNASWVEVTYDGEKIKSTLVRQKNGLSIDLQQSVVIAEGKSLVVTITQ